MKSKIKFIVLFFSICSLTIFAKAQNIGGTPLLQLSQIQREQIKSGSVHINMEQKQLGRSDTSHVEADLFFWRDITDSLGLNQFILKADHGITFAYNTQIFYSFYENSKSYNSISNDPSQVQSWLRGSALGPLVHSFYSKHNIQIDSSFWNSAELSSKKENGETVLLIQKSISFPQEKVSPDMRDSLLFQIEIALSLPSFQVHSYSEWYHPTSDHQYTRFLFSKPLSLMPEATFESIAHSQEYVKEYTIVSVDEEIPVIHVGSRMPEVELIDIDQQPIEIGTKFLLLDFWYTSCYPCLKAIPILHEIIETHGTKLQVVGINPIDSDLEKINTFIQKKDIEYPIIQDKKGLIAAQFGVTAYPTLVLINMDSKKVAFVQVGVPADLKESIISILETEH